MPEKGKANVNTSKKRMKAIEKSGGWDPFFVEVKSSKPKETHTVKPKQMRGAANFGNRPVDATRRKSMKRRKQQNGRNED